MTMKRSAGMKWITLIILIIAAISLVFGSFIMLLGAGDASKVEAPTRTTLETEAQ